MQKRYEYSSPVAVPTVNRLLKNAQECTQMQALAHICRTNHHHATKCKLSYWAAMTMQHINKTLPKVLAALTIVTATGQAVAATDYKEKKPKTEILKSNIVDDGAAELRFHLQTIRETVSIPEQLDLLQQMIIGDDEVIHVKDLPPLPPNPENFNN